MSMNQGPRQRDLIARRPLKNIHSHSHNHNHRSGKPHYLLILINANVSLPCLLPCGNGWPNGPIWQQATQRPCLPSGSWLWGKACPALFCDSVSDILTTCIGMFKCICSCFTRTLAMSWTRPIDSNPSSKSWKSTHPALIPWGRKQCLWKRICLCSLLQAGPPSLFLARWQPICVSWRSEHGSPWTCSAFVMALWLPCQPRCRLSETLASFIRLALVDSICCLALSGLSIMIVHPTFALFWSKSSVAPRVVWQCKSSKTLHLGKKYSHFMVSTTLAATMKSVSVIRAKGSYMWHCTLHDRFICCFVNLLHGSCAACLLLDCKKEPFSYLLHLFPPWRQVLSPLVPTLAWLCKICHHAGFQQEDSKSGFHYRRLKNWPLLLPNFLLRFVGLAWPVALTIRIGDSAVAAIDIGLCIITTGQRKPSPRHRDSFILHVFLNYADDYSLLFSHLLFVLFYLFTFDTNKIWVTLVGCMLVAV